MTMRKLLTIILLVGIASLLSSCSKNENKAKASAETFLSLYFQTNYESASALCTQELGKELLESMKNIESLEPSIKEKIIEQTSKIKTEIVTIEELGRDSLMVNYKVTLPSFPNGIDNKMVLVKRDKEWLVAGFGQSAGHKDE